MLKSSISEQSFDHKAAVLKRWNPNHLINERNKFKLLRKFKRVPPAAKLRAFETLFSRDDWFRTWSKYDREVRGIWTRQVSAHVMRGEWKLHCIDARAICRSDRRCFKLYNDFIDQCRLNEKSLDRKMKGVRMMRSCRNRYRMRRRRKEPKAKLINRSAPDPTEKSPQVKQRMRKMPSYDDVMEKMRFWAGKRHDDVYAKWFEDLEETCPVGCYDSLNKFNSTIYAPLLNKCDLRFSHLPRNLSQRVRVLGFSRRSNLWDEKIWKVQRRRVDQCRPKVYRTTANKKPGCTLVVTVCRKNPSCFNAYRDVIKSCAGAIQGRKCHLGCKVAMAELYKHAPNFYRCRPDGLKRPQWWK